MSPALGEITRLIDLSEHEEALLDAHRDHAARLDTGGWLSAELAFQAMYADDPNGGPEPHRMYTSMRLALASLADKVERFGISFERRYRYGTRLHLIPSAIPAPAPHTFAGKSGGFRRRFRPVPCHCCRQTIFDPSLEQVMSHYKLQPRERQVLRAIDGLPGRVGSLEWLLDAVEDERPRTRRERYSALKVAISYARTKLRGSGVVVKNLGYGLGYTIVDEVGA